MKRAAITMALAALAALAALLLLAAWKEPDIPASAPPAPGRDTATASVTGTAVPHGDMFRQFAAWGDHAAVAADLALTDEQQLIPDMALRRLYDSYLLDGALPRTQRLQALAQRLRGALPPGAALQAIAIAERYQAYLAAHDELLAAQHFTGADAAAQDPERIRAWQRQRQQLRERTLGARMSLEWFGSDDAYLDQALEEWRQRMEGQAPGDAAPADPDQQLHERHMRRALEQAIAPCQLAASAS